MRGTRWIWRNGPDVISVTAAVALALEWTVRDAVPVVSALYYAAPMPLLAAGLLGGLTLAALREQAVRTIACASLLVAVAATQRTTLLDAPPPRKTAVAAPLRGLVWNVWRARPGLRLAIEEIRRHAPDVFVLVEPPVDPHGDPLVELRERMPEYEFGFVTKHFVVGARDAVHVSGRIELDGGNAARARVEVGGVEIALICVDIRSNPFMHRRGPLEAVAALAGECGDGPALVMGDFNTPRRSVHFASLRADWTHAFEAVGAGHDATWPEPLPVHALDHVWGRGVRFVDCRTAPMRLSDHRPVVFSFEPLDGR